MKISGGLSEKGIVVGNAYDKYGSANPFARRLMHGFDSELSDLMKMISPASLHEVGCGEGFWTLRWLQQGLEARGSDFSEKVIQLARANAVERRLSPGRFKVRSIYDLDPEIDAAEMVVCCEVLEHLERPHEGLEALRSISRSYLVASVPREPIWCLMNLVRGKYVGRLGNTPGHVQKWSKREFVKLMSRYFEVIEVRTPVPWTIVLCRPRMPY